MTQSLFVESDLTFEKTGSEVTLPDDPTQWPTEILQELYKQIPFVSDFMPDIIMDRVDGEKRYGFGHVEVSNKTEMQDSPESQTAQAAGIRHVRIPIIVKEGKLQPFDVLVTDTSKMLPLTERRLRQSLFRPQLFDVTSRTPGDQSMISQLYPPYRQNYGFGGGGATMSAGMGKEGTVGPDMRTLAMGAVPKEKRDSTPGEIAPATPEKTAHLLSAILHTIDPADYERFARTMTQTGVKVAARKNQVFLGPAIDVLTKYAGVDRVALRAEKLAYAIIPTAIQVSRAPGEGYKVKMASHRYWAPLERIVDRGELVRSFGAKTAMDVDTAGAVTGGDGPVAEDLPEHDEPELIGEYGIYKVQDSNGRQLIGFVFPNLIDIDGTSMPIALFTNGACKAVQGEIVGVRVSEGAALIEGKPTGAGVFYRVMQNGKAVATIPLNIQSSVQSPEGASTLMATSPMHGDAQVQLSIQENIKMPVMSDEQTLLIPSDWSWLPLDQAEDVELCSDPAAFEKAAHAVHHSDFVEIRAGGPSVFSFSGVPVEKLGYDARSFLSLDDSMFLLAGLGVSPEYSVQKLGEAVHHQEPIRVQTSRHIETPESVREAIFDKMASENVVVPNLRVDLVKEAAVLPDTTAVDTVLSLGFINPENVLTFVGYLPYLDETQEKLCELLIAARMGLRDIEPTVLERSIRGIEATIEGLRTLAFQGDG